MTGTLQSPLNVPATNHLDSLVPPALRTSWYYPPLVSNGSNIEVINNGHTIQIEWLGSYSGHVSIAVPATITNTTKITSVLDMKANDSHTTVSIAPAQFHFHTTSEHLVSGRYFPLEMHIVHKLTAGLPACANGCYTVTGIMFELCVECEDNPLLEAIWDVMPDREGQINYLPAGAEIKLHDFISKLANPHPAYVTYAGSLTTPPCTEGLLWHVLLKPQNISVAQWRAYKEAVSFKECELKNATQAHHHRHHHRSLHRHLRHMLSEEPVGNPNDWTCSLAAYGTNFRTAQPANGRVIRYAH